MKCEVIAFTAGLLCARHLSSVLCQLAVKLPNSPTGGEERGLWRLGCWSLNLGFATRPIFERQGGFLELFNSLCLRFIISGMTLSLLTMPAASPSLSFN